jgi:enterobactin synthetase component D
MHCVTKGDSLNSVTKDNKNTFIVSESLITIPRFNELYLYRCEFNKASFEVSFFEQFNIQFVDTLMNAVDKRKSEYLAGRYCANNALKKLNIHNVNITPGGHRAPIWPAGVIGSITHTKNHAFAAVTENKHYTYLGIDYEQFMTRETANEVKSTIISQREDCLLNDVEWDFEQALTLAFSAKESLFKALYPYVGKYFDFSAAELVCFSNQKQSFELILLESLSCQLTKGMSFKGWFEQTNSHVLTVIAL